MASLAEQFLDDVDRSEEEETPNAIPSAEDSSTPSHHPAPQDQFLTDASPTQPSSTNALNATFSEQISLLLSRIRVSSPSDAISTQNALVSECTAAVASIDEQIVLLHQSLLKAYHPRFPELETLILNPLDYARVARVIAEQMDLTSVDLRSILPSGTSITVQLAASNSKGRKLNREELQLVYSLCTACADVESWRAEMLEFIESRAGIMAPNLVAIVGGAVAASLMGFAGGLRELSVMPSCNVKVLGKTKKTLEGGSSQTTRLHEGVIFTSPLVRSLPKKFRSKAGEIMSGKVVLAARVDAFKSAKDGSVGQELRKKLEEKYEKWQELAPAKTKKPLPIPGEETKRKHRGGRRARKEKERLGISEARKLANRVKFGVGNEMENDELGMLGTEGSNKLRIQKKKNEGVTLAGRKRLEKQKRQDKKSDAEKLGIVSKTDHILEDSFELRAKPAVADGTTPKADKRGSNTTQSYFSSSTPFHGVSLRDREIKK